MKIAMFLDNPFTNDLRVYREAKELAANGHSLTVFCTQKKNTEDEEFMDGFQIKRIFPADITSYSSEKTVRTIALKIAEQDFQVFHCHDQYMCDAGAAIKRKFPSKIIVYDSHELFHAWPLNNLMGLPLSVKIKSFLITQYQIRREKKNAKWIDYCITVNQSLAQILHKYLTVKEFPLVIRNAPELANVTNVVDLKSKFNIPKDEELLVFIGAHIYAKTHNHEQVIDEIGNQSGLHLLYITNESKGCNDVKEYVRAKGFNNIYFHQAVKPTEIASYLAGCDVGLVPTWNKKNLSYWLALDNKLFEYTIAEIPILATQQPEYKNIIEHYNNGICVNPDVPNAYLDGLKKIIANYNFYKTNSVEAKKELNWNSEKNKLIQFYKKIGESIN